MNKTTTTLFVLVVIGIVAYWIISVQVDFVPTLFWHDFFASIASWAVLMIITIYILEKKLKQRKKS